MPRISTLHSFALRQILRNAARTSLPQPLRIADDFEERWIIVEEIGALIGRTVPETQRLFQQLSSDWERLTPEWRERFLNPQFLGAWLEHRQVYGYTLRAELVYQLKVALDEHDLELEGPPQHVLVDEYQDLNACDLAVMGPHVYPGTERWCQTTLRPCFSKPPMSSSSPPAEPRLYAWITELRLTSLPVGVFRQRKGHH